MSAGIFCYPPAIRNIALKHPRLSYRHVTTWTHILSRAYRGPDAREELRRIAADAVAHEFVGRVLSAGRFEQCETPEGFEIKLDAYALRYDQLIDLLYEAYREGQSERAGPALMVGMDGKEDALRKSLSETVEVLEAALSSHGTLLLSDPPQEAWKVGRIEERARAAIARARSVMG